MNIILGCIIHINFKILFNKKIIIFIKIFCFNIKNEKLKPYLVTKKIDKEKKIEKKLKKINLNQ